MQNVFSVDGRYFDVRVVDLKRSASVLDTDNSGRVKSGKMIRDIIGTYYNYTIEIKQNRQNVKEYDELFEILTSPVEKHIIRVPYAQGTLQFEAYVANAEDYLKIEHGVKYWGGLTLSFVALAPQREA